MIYRHIFFDLDGTLTNPGLGITNSVAYALRRYGIEENDRKNLYRFIGPPLIESFMLFYGFSTEQAKEAVGVYREYYVPKGIFENEVYDGIPEMLCELKECGAKLYVASSKPEPFVIEILKHFGLFKYFKGVYGSTMDDSRTRKDEIIAYALESEYLSPSEVIMVGDRYHDIVGAEKNSMKSVGVTYGYGSREEHESCGADMIVDTVEELKYILKGSK